MLPVSSGSRKVKKLDRFEKARLAASDLPGKLQECAALQRDGDWQTPSKSVSANKPTSFPGRSPMQALGIAVSLFCAGLFLAALLCGTGVAIYYAHCVKTATKQLRETVYAILRAEFRASGAPGADGRERRPRYNPAHCVAVCDDRSPVGTSGSQNTPQSRSSALCAHQRRTADVHHPQLR